MTAFTETIIDDKGVGEMLRASREALGLTPKEVEKETRVASKYIIALEEHAFSKLPETIYAKNFVRALSRFYKLDQDIMVDALMREMIAVTGTETSNDSLIERLQAKNFVATPTVFKIGILGIAFLALVSYFAFSVHSILRAPTLIVHSPRDSQVFGIHRIVLEGTTDPEVELTVNQEAILIESDGTFKEILNLPEGVSILRVAAKKRHSKAREIYIKVMIDPKDTVEKVDIEDGEQEEEPIAQR